MGRVSRRGVRPVLVAAVLVTAAIAVAAPVSYWMGGVTPIGIKIDKLEVSSVEVFKGVSSYKVVLTVRNTGELDLTIGRILIDGKLLAEYSSPVLNSTFYPASGTLANGEKGIVTIGVGSRSVPPFTPGATLEVTVCTNMGRLFPQNVTLT